MAILLNLVKKTSGQARYEEEEGIPPIGQFLEEFFFFFFPCK